MFDMNEKEIMQRVFKLAEKARSRTSPNPMVGAILVKNGKIVGQGYHQKAGKPHAEILAIRQAGKHSINGTLYVNLEPCCHFGKTPPCTDAIIRAGIRRVVYSVNDPNPLVNGKGAKALLQAGVEVRASLLDKEATRLNEAYFKFMKTGKPLIVLKIEQTLDGKELDHRSIRRIWYNLSRQKNQSNDIPVADALIADSRVSFLLAHKKENHQSLIKSVSTWKAGVNTRGDALAVLKQLTQKGVLSVMMDGNGKISAQFLKYGLVDKVYAFVSFEIGGSRSTFDTDLGIDRISDALKLSDVRYQTLSGGLLVSGYLN